VVQIVSHELGIPISLIHLSETRTDTVANSSPTAASASSDLNGMALVDACRKIMERLEPLKQQNPDISWKDVRLNH
jgi:xanthine dehydrogenase/oxidase